VSLAFVPPGRGGHSGERMRIGLSSSSSFSNGSSTSHGHRPRATEGTPHRRSTRQARRRTSVAAAVAAAAAALPLGARADIAGFGDGSQFTLNGNGNSFQSGAGSDQVL